MMLTGTKAWAKEVLKEQGVNKVKVNKKARRLSNAKTKDLYREIEALDHN